MNPKHIVKALTSLPQLRLSLLEIVWECCDGEGQIDQKKLSLRALEIDRAVKEAKAYAWACARMGQEVTRCAKN